MALFHRPMKPTHASTPSLTTPFNANAPTQDDRLWAGLSYAGSVFCLCGLPALLIFFLKRGESAYIRFHAVQAFCVAMLWLGMVVLALWMTVSLHTPFALGFFLFLSPIVLWALLMVRTFMGKSADLPLLAPLISRFTSDDSRF